MVARLVPIRSEKAALTRALQPQDKHDQQDKRDKHDKHDNYDRHGKQDEPGQPPRARPAARHARTSGPPAPQHTSLSIRSAERRRWSADLSRPDVTALVVCGLGGIGKSTLAAQIASRMSRLAPERVVTVLSGEVSPACLASAPAETDLVVLDDFDDNLSGPGSERTVRDPALAAILASWTGKLLITCDAPFTAPGAPPYQPHQPYQKHEPHQKHQREQRDRFVFRHLGPLTRSGAAELALSLPALRQLGEPERELAWRLTAGHPRAMEYLDSLLAAGLRFDDLAGRVTGAVRARIGWPPASTEPTELSEATAEVIALTAGQQLLGELLGRLSAGARDLLVRASVFRTPVTPGVLAARPADVAEDRAAGLLSPRPGRELGVHRWTAAELHRRLAEAGQTARLAAAHRQAAGYWHARTATPQLGPRAELEAAYHLRQAGDLAAGSAATATGPGPPAVPATRRRVRRLCLTAAAGVTAVVLAVQAADSLSASHLAPAERPGRPAEPAPLTQAAAVRDQTAAWVASQVSAGAIVACDPVMCSVLVGHGFPAANLLVLGAGAPDPLGSAVVLATSAVRAMFGSRLATVYAPQTLASFGAGEARIDVRAVAADGAAAYRTALAADVRARQVAGLQLLADPRVAIAPPARAALAAGRVDARLLITLAALAANERVQILAFGDDGPGAGPGTPLRTAEVTAAAPAARAMLVFVRAQRPPFLPARSGLSGGPGDPGARTVLTIGFTAPSPLGLLPSHP